MSIAKINSFYFQISPYIIFLVKPVLILLKTTRSINISQKHITGQHITEKRAKTLKHCQITSLHTFLALFLQVPLSPTSLLMVYTIPRVL